MDAAAIADAFGLSGPAVLSDGPVARGRQGAVWRMETPDARWAVKAAFQSLSEDQVAPAAVFQEAACAAGAPAPRVRRTVDGAVLATVDDRQVRLYEWVDLLPPDPMLDPAQVGECVARLHRVDVEVVGALDPWYSQPMGPARWDALVERLRAAGAPFSGRLADLRDELVALESWIEPSAVVRTLHRDLWADNVLATPQGGLCVVDWESSGPGDPSQEVGCVVFEFARSDPGRVRALLSAYEQAGGPGSLTRRAHWSMLIAQLGHITETAALDWLEPNPRSPSRAEAQAWVCEVLDEPHTRAVLDDLLVAAGG